MAPLKACKKSTQTLYNSVKLEKPIDDPKHVAREHVRKKLVEELQRCGS